MDGARAIKPDSKLRHFLAHPETIEPSTNRSPGFAARRFLVAIFDAAQMVVTSVVAASVFSPHKALASIGIGIMGASLALAIRRGLRPTTSLRRATIGRTAQRSGFAVFAACTIMLAIIVLVDGPAHATQFAPWILSWGALSAGISYGARMLPVPAIRRVMLRAIQPTVAIVGDTASAEIMADMLFRQGNHSVADRFDPDSASQMRLLEHRARRGMIDKVVVIGNDALIEDVCFALADTPTLVCIGFATSMTSSLMADGFGATQHPPFLPLVPSPMSDWQGLLKRMLDVAVVLIALPLMAPVLFLAAAAIKLESRGPILFRQWRFGLGSKPTRIFKFRTMYHALGDSTGEIRTRALDPRVTVVGRILRRTSIDELPQLLNVLRGEMSLVGPRPHATHMKVDGNYYFEVVQSYRFRHRVKPGITGWAQVTGSRGEVDTIDKALERVEKDLWYVRNWSLALDLRILTLTALGRFASPRAD